MIIIFGFWKLGKFARFQLIFLFQKDEAANYDLCWC